jgi:hypothetical protein
MTRLTEQVGLVAVCFVAKRSQRHELGARAVCLIRVSNTCLTTAICSVGMSGRVSPPSASVTMPEALVIPPLLFQVATMATRSDTKFVLQISATLCLL